jgi:cyanate lyase
MTRVLKKKLSLDLSGKEPSAYYYLDGKQVLRVRITNVHGSATLSVGAANELKNSLGLDEEGLRRLYNCPMKGKDFENKIRGMGLV